MEIFFLDISKQLVFDRESISYGHGFCEEIMFFENFFMILSHFHRVQNNWKVLKKYHGHALKLDFFGKNK